MLENGSSNETPATEQGPLSKSMSQMGGKCLAVISEFCKGQCTTLDKVRAISAITDILSSASPLLVENEINDSLDTYLQIIKQHERSLVAGQAQASDWLGVPSDVAAGTKQAVSPAEPHEVTKRPKVDEKDFLWVIWESITGPELLDELQKTLSLLQTYAKDLKLTKSSILTSPFMLQFSSSEWSNIIIGTMVDLNHIISGSFTVSSDNRQVKVIGSIQFKFGAAKGSKHVKSLGDWFIVWNMYSKAVSFTFPYRLGELSMYSLQILGLFSATAPECHSNIINLDKAIWVQIGEQCDLQVTDHTMFEDFWLYLLNPIGAGDPGKAKEKTKLDCCSEDPGDRWNIGACMQVKTLQVQVPAYLQRVRWKAPGMQCKDVETRSVWASC